MSSLLPAESALLKTLVYFDVFDYPLRPVEALRWVYGTRADQLKTTDQTTKYLQALADRGLIEERDGFWYLSGRSSIVETRRSRQADNQRKWAKAKTAAQYLMIAPFVDMVAVVNTVAINNARPESDIDLLIVVRSGWMWLARAFVTGIIQLLGYRRHGNKIANRICLSFYVTEDALDLEPYAKGDDDVHYRYWLTEAVPLINRQKTFERFMQANQWVTRYLPNGFTWDWSSHVLPPLPGLPAVQGVLELGFNTPFGIWLNHWLGDRQQKKMAKNEASRQNDQTSDVVISDSILKFHEADRREAYNQAFRDRVANIDVQ